MPTPSKGIAPKPKGLDQRERLFVRAYAISLNGKQAAIEAGVPEKGAHVWASRALRRPNVAAALKEIFARAEERGQVRLDDVIAEAKSIAFFRMGEFVTVGSDGNPYLDLSAATPEQLASIPFNEITTEEYVEGRGEDGRDVKKTRVKFESKMAALIFLRRHLGGAFEREGADKGGGNTTNVTFNVQMNIGEGAPAARGQDARSYTKPPAIGKANGANGHAD